MTARKEGAGLRTARVAGHTPGTDLGGIRSAEDIRERCAIVGDDDCWHWRGAVDAKSGLPKMWFPLFGLTITPGPVIGFLRTGVRPKRARWLRQCMTADCVNPDHWGPSSHSAACLRTSRRNPAMHVLKSTIARRVRAKLTDESVTDIRSRINTAQHYAHKYSISVGHVYRVLAGNNWKPLGIPANSVFSLADTL